MPRFDAPGVCRSRSRAGRAGRGRLAATLVLLTMCCAPIALAQTTTPKKKGGAKAAATASSSAAPEPSPPPPPTPEPEPAPAAEKKSDTEAKAEPKAESSDWDVTNTTEDAQKKYYFVGIRYRGTIIPKFIQNLFVDEGGTVYSNSFAVEVDIRQDGRSMIPWIQYTDYSMGDTLFLTKGKDPNDTTQYSVVNSGLKALYLGLDEMWSAPIAEHFDFEYGFGVGIGFVFGDLQNNWVYGDPNGPLKASNGLQLSKCQNVNSDPSSVMSCQPAQHQNASEAKVGNYVEKNWFNGGSVPVVFPHISIPQIGLRYKPIKQLEARLQVGFSITGFWWGLGVDYGLEKDERAEEGKPKPKHKDKDQDGDKPQKESSGYYVPGRDTL